MSAFRRITRSGRVEHHVQDGLAAYRSGAFEQAIREFSEALELDPGSVPAHYQRGMAFARSGDQDRAADEFAWVAERATDPRLAADAWFNLAHAHENMGDLDAAVGEYARAAGSEHIAEKALCNRGSVLSRLGRFEEAVQDLSRAIELDPSDALAYWDRAIANQALGVPEEVVDEDLRRFVRLAPADHPYRPKAEKLLGGGSGAPTSILDRHAQQEVGRLVERAIGLNDEEHYEDAVEACDRILELDADLEVAWDEKAFALMALDRWDEALAACDRGLATIPTAVRLHHTRGSILDHEGRHREALSEYRTYVKVAPPEYGQVVAQVRTRIRQLEAQL